MFLRLIIFMKQDAHLFKKGLISHALLHLAIIIGYKPLSLLRFYFSSREARKIN